MMHISTEPSIGARLPRVHETIEKQRTQLTWPRLECKRWVEKVLSHADIAIDGGRPWDINIRDDRFYGRVLLHGSLGLGESYVDGWWDARALDQFFSRVLCASLDSNPLWNWRLGLQRLVSEKFNQQTRPRAKRAAEEHYDLGNELYQNMLDRRMVYTCARWEHAANLDEAQERKLDFVCGKLSFQPGMTLLDIGCGWGSLAKFVAQKYGVTVLGITLSKQQMRLAQERCNGLPITIRLWDYRDVHETFDRVVSLGMFEHVGYRNYRRFFAVAHDCLRPGGLLFFSTIGSNHSKHTTDPWFDKYIFPNSYLPSTVQITGAMEGLFAIEDWENWRPDYDRTVMAWFKNFQQHWQDLEPLYGERFYRMWKYYLMAAAACFRSRRNQVWQILALRE